MEPEPQNIEAPYQPSWIDRLTGWIDGLPGPAWLFYLLTVAALALLNHVVFWIDGGLAVGSFDQAVATFALYTIYWLGLYHYLTRIGSRALKVFRPLLEAPDSEINEVDTQLSTLPRRLGWLAVPLGLGLTVVTLLSEPEDASPVAHTTVPVVLEFAMTSFLGSTFVALVIRSIRQLRLVSRLHERASNIDLLELAPSHAFSALTARTGVGLILLLVSVYILEPLGTATALDVISYVGIALLAVAIFVWPLAGMQARLEKERDRVLSETDDLLRISSDRLHTTVRSHRYDDMVATDAAIAALMRERDFIMRISTWPWDPRTVRGFASALLLPIFLWLVTRLLERFL